MQGKFAAFCAHHGTSYTSQQAQQMHGTRSMCTAMLHTVLLENLDERCIVEHAPVEEQHELAVQVDVANVAELRVPQAVGCRQLLVELVQPDDDLLLLVAEVVVEALDVLHAWRRDTYRVVLRSCRCTASAAPALVVRKPRYMLRASSSCAF